MGSSPFLGLGSRVWGSGFRVQGLGFRVLGFTDLLRVSKTCRGRRRVVKVLLSCFCSLRAAFRNRV